MSKWNLWFVGTVVGLGFYVLPQFLFGRVKLPVIGLLVDCCPTRQVNPMTFGQPFVSRLVTTSVNVGFSVDFGIERRSTFYFTTSRVTNPFGLRFDDSFGDLLSRFAWFVDVGFQVFLRGFFGGFGGRVCVGLFVPISMVGRY